MANTFEHLTVPAGADLFREGEPGTSAYIVEQGCVEIWIERGGQRVAIAERGVGDIVGEMAMVDAGPRSATATALEDCVLFEITAQQFRRRTDAMDPVMRTCLGVMLDRFRRTLAMIDASSAAEVASARNPWPCEHGPSFSLDRLRLEREIEQGIAQDQFELHYQPIISFDMESIAGYEALIRWRHPLRGLISPAEFIPVAEESGAIQDLTRWVFARTSRDLGFLMSEQGRWSADQPFVSLNVSATSLSDLALPDEFGAMAKALGADPAMLKLEITESALMDDPEQAIRALRRFRDFGFSLAVDDFGTGYSSLSYLTRLPVSTLKIDRSFVTALETDPAKEKIVRTILLLAKELELTVIAEGIETLNEKNRLLELGCGFGQGYYFAKPMPPAHVPRFLMDWQVGVNAAAARLAVG